MDTPTSNYFTHPLSNFLKFKSLLGEPENKEEILDLELEKVNLILCKIANKFKQESDSSGKWISEAYLHNSGDGSSGDEEELAQSPRGIPIGNPSPFPLPGPISIEPPIQLPMMLPGPPSNPIFTGLPIQVSTVPVESDLPPPGPLPVVIPAPP